MTDVVIVSSADCHLCQQAKAALGRVSEDYPLRIREVTLDSPEGRRLALDSGAAFPPVILLDGELFSYGRLPERKLRKRMAARHR